MARFDALLLAALLSSGVAALGLELIWVRVLGVAFGIESIGMLGVLSGFFAGLAVGSAALHDFVTRAGGPSSAIARPSVSSPRTR